MHRTFLEFFCAWEFVWQFEKERSITIEDLKTEVFGKHWQDETWHEVLRLIAGMIEAKFVGEILDYLMAQDGEEEIFINLFLAAKCLAEVRNRHVIELVDSKLRKNVKRLTKYGNIINFSEENIEDFRKYRENNHSVYEIRTKAITAVVSTKPFLQKHATSDQDSCDSPDEAVRELARGWKDDPDTLSFFKELATSDKYSISVQLSAVEELARTFNQEPGMFEFLRVIAVTQPSKGNNLFDNRSVVLQVIIKQFPQHPQTLPLLRDRAENDPDEQVRNFAQEKLKQWRE